MGIRIMDMKTIMHKCMILTIFIRVLLDFVKPNERWIHNFPNHQFNFDNDS